MLRNQKAISQLLAAIILIAIVLAGSLVFLAVFTDVLNIGAGNCVVEVKSVTLHSNSEGNYAIFTITLKNTGDKPIANIKLNIKGEPNLKEYDLTQSQLMPGQTHGFQWTPTAEYHIEDTYVFTVEAIASDGSSFTYSNTLSCEETTAPNVENQYMLTIVATENGEFDPAAGIYVYDDGAAVQVQAVPGTSCTLDHWVLDGSDAGTSNPLQVTMSQNHTVTAVFTAANAEVIFLATGLEAVSESEQIVNGGFETGDLAGWWTSTPGNPPTIANQPCTGVHSAQLSPPVREPCSLLQSFPENLLTANVASFTFYAKHVAGNSDDFEVIIQYLSNYDYIKISIAIDSEWHQIDLKPYLRVSDTLMHFGFIVIPKSMQITYLIDDVSLIAGEPLDYPVLKVDGASVNNAELPKMFNWTVGSTHQFEWFSPISVNDEQYVWLYSTGLNTTQSGIISVLVGGGSVNAFYSIGYPIVITSSAGGTTDPAPGTYWRASGTTFDITAEPEASYVLDYWEVNSVPSGNATVLHLLVDAAYNVSAVFRLSIVPITFDTSGLTSDAAGTVLTIGGEGDFTQADLPVTFDWTIGSPHDYAYSLIVFTGDVQYVWSSTAGLSTLRSDVITVPSGGGIVNATYLLSHEHSLLSSFSTGFEEAHSGMRDLVPPWDGYDIGCYTGGIQVGAYSPFPMLVPHGGTAFFLMDGNAFSCYAYKRIEVPELGEVPTGTTLLLECWYFYGFAGYYEKVNMLMGFSRPGTVQDNRVAALAFITKDDYQYGLVDRSGSFHQASATVSRSWTKLSLEVYVSPTEGTVKWYLNGVLQQTLTSQNTSGITRFFVGWASFGNTGNTSGWDDVSFSATEPSAGYNKEGKMVEIDLSLLSITNSITLPFSNGPIGAIAVSQKYSLVDWLNYWRDRDPPGAILRITLIYR